MCSLPEFSTLGQPQGPGDRRQHGGPGRKEGCTRAASVQSLPCERASVWGGTRGCARCGLGWTQAEGEARKDSGTRKSPSPGLRGPCPDLCARGGGTPPEPANRALPVLSPGSVLHSISARVSPNSGGPFGPLQRREAGQRCGHCEEAWRRLTTPNRRSFFPAKPVPATDPARHPCIHSSLRSYTSFLHLRTFIRAFP